MKVRLAAPPYGPLQRSAPGRHARGGRLLTDPASPAGGFHCSACRPTSLDQAFNPHLGRNYSAKRFGGHDPTVASGIDSAFRAELVEAGYRNTREDRHGRGTHSRQVVTGGGREDIEVERSEPERSLPFVRDVRRVDHVREVELLHLPGERPGTVAGDVGAGHIDHLEPVESGLAGDRCHVQGSRVRAGHVREGPVILVEHQPLRTLVDHRIGTQRGVVAKAHGTDKSLHIRQEAPEDRIACDKVELLLREARDAEGEQARRHPFSPNAHQDGLEIAAAQIGHGEDMGRREAALDRLAEAEPTTPVCSVPAGPLEDLVDHQAVWSGDETPRIRRHRDVAALGCNLRRFLAEEHGIAHEEPAEVGRTARQGARAAMVEHVTNSVGSDHRMARLRSAVGPDHRRSRMPGGQIIRHESLALVAVSRADDPACDLAHPKPHCVGRPRVAAHLVVSGETPQSASAVSRRQPFHRIGDDQRGVRIPGVHDVRHASAGGDPDG